MAPKMHYNVSDIKTTEFNKLKELKLMRRSNVKRNSDKNAIAAGDCLSVVCRRRKQS